MNKAYRKSRYDKGTADYINCPMTVDEFNAFYEAVITAERLNCMILKKRCILKAACLLKSWRKGAATHCCLDR